MKLTQQEQAQAAKEFAAVWKDRGDEKSDTQSFWLTLLQNVFGVENAERFIEFEKRVQLGHTSFIDGYIQSTLVLIEQKSIDINLRTSAKQSDGTMLDPFGQAHRYASHMKRSEFPRWIVTCNFKSFLVYDMENPNSQPEEILLENLEKEYYRLSFLASAENIHLKREMELSIQAGTIVGQIYDKLLSRYKNPDSDLTLKSLNVLCVRLVFCLYAEDAGLFATKSQFHDYLEQFTAKQMRSAIIELFEVLNTPQEYRDKYLDPDLAAFPYVNGGLFGSVGVVGRGTGDEACACVERNASEVETSAEKSRTDFSTTLEVTGKANAITTLEVTGIEIPQFDEELRTLLLEKASEDFDWSDISPTIFGAVFESTLNPDTRRSGGMHYTSIENIHKVIDPLFMARLQNEFDEICRIKSESSRNEKLDALQNKIGNIKILDPACGSGNFLTESYLSLRKLENEIIKRRNKGDALLGFDEFVKVKINNFYGIEINDFAVSVAKTALWIAEEQMMEETSRIVDVQFDFLPLKTNACIVEGNALRLDWSTFRPTSIKANAIYADKTNIYKINDDSDFSVCEPLAPKYGEVNIVTREVEFKNVEELNEAAEISVEFDYIIGNPPFVGYGFQTARQKEDTLLTYRDENGKPYKTAGKIDYVANWYFKAAQLICGKKTRCAFVSTNSITQGEQVASVFKPLFERFGFGIDFAYRTFRWDSESTQKAHVHCVIIGFSCHTDLENPNGFSGNKGIALAIPNPCDNPKIIFDSDGNAHEAKNINPYLLDASLSWIESRPKPICDVPYMTTGNRPADGGHLIIEADEYDDFIKKEPAAAKYIKNLTGAEEYINNKKRYCLWLVGASPAEIRKMPEVYKRVQKCREDRLNGAPDRQKLADTPTLFRELKNQEKYIIVPATSSEKRKYIPLGFMTEDTIPTNSAVIIPDATLYHFGVLTSSAHMAWMRAVCGRLEMRYRYSKDIVYNNFVWCEPTTEQKEKIEQTAQAILDARAKYPDSSLADLYDETIMPTDLRKAHQANDQAVLAAYGWQKDITESEIVANLMQMYQEMVG